MNIKTANNPTGDKTFSEDTLKIEKCGPNEDYLTVIDVPGIFRTTTEGVTTTRDQEMVRTMVKDYIKNSRTIILAVLPSNVDVATQEILTLAEKYDVDGERTLGILTKPDLVLERSAKLSVCSLLEGRKKPLKLGYFLVRNRGGDQDDENENAASSLTQREAMFQEEPWNSLPDDRLGVFALRERLQELLGHITNREFPKLRAETRGMLEEAEKELDDLGPARQTDREQQQYLMTIAGKFQTLVRAALDANYSSHAAFDNGELRLITAVVNTTDRFNKDFADTSRTYFFESERATSAKLPAPIRELLNGDWLPEKTEKTDSETASNNTDASNPEMFRGLEKIISPEEPVARPIEGIMEWIESVYQGSRGIELGTFSPTVLASVFREQSKKWEPITEQYVSKVIQHVHQFVSKALEVVCADETVRENLMEAIMGGLVSRYTDCMDQAKLLVNVERQLKPYTLNQYFNNSRQKAQGSRMAKILESHARTELRTEKSVIDVDAIPTAVTKKSNKKHDIESIHDILEAYYKVATTRFVDNVFQQAVDYKLLSGPNSPLRLFSEQWVVHLSDEVLTSVARESRMIRDRRKKLKRTIEDLKAAVDILR